jgi:hypothetical protein
MLFRVTATRTFHGESSTNSVQLPTVHIEADNEDEARAKADRFIGPSPENVTVKISIEEMEWEFAGDYYSDLPVYLETDFETEDS